jgi:hypothetical protein
MSDLLKAVKAKLQNDTCVEHKEKALISISGETLSFKCCCENFKKKMHDKMKIEVRNVTQEMIKKMFKK